MIQRIELLLLSPAFRIAFAVAVIALAILGIAKVEPQ